MAAPDAVRTVLVLLDLRVVRRAQAAQVVEAIVRRRFGASRPCDDVVDMRRPPAAALHRAAAGVAPQCREPQLAPVSRRVIAVSRQCRHPKPGTSGPTGSASRRFRIARRDGLTFAERVRIYERELARLMAEEPAYQPAPTAPPTAPCAPCSA